MAYGHGGRRPGAGRKRKNSIKKPSIPLEKSVAQLMSNVTAYNEQPTNVKQLAHKVAYMEQELEFVKKIILASLEEKPKC